MYLDAFNYTLFKLTIAKFVHSTVHSFSAYLDGLPPTKSDNVPCNAAVFPYPFGYTNLETSHALSRPIAPFFALLLLCFASSTMAAFNGSTDALFLDDFFGEFTNGGDYLAGAVPEVGWPLSDWETGASSVPAASTTSLRKSPSFLLISYSMRYSEALSGLFFISIYFIFYSDFYSLST